MIIDAFTLSAAILIVIVSAFLLATRNHPRCSRKETVPGKNLLEGREKG